LISGLQLIQDSIVYQSPMSENLLRTKLFIPPRRQNLVERPRLFEKLDCGLVPANRLIMVTAPAGFGKTTLVSEWARSTRLPLGWLTLDEGDNDSLRFLRYIVAALQSVDARIGEAIQATLHGFQPPAETVVLTEIINDMLLLEGPSLIVLDDYHLISSAKVHAGVNFLIEHLPPTAHLVIATRADPPLQLARRRGQGSICELRAADLRFTGEEVAAFINQVMGLNLTVEDVAALESRTEGWVASLQMAALSLRDTTDRHAFVTAFSGDNRYIADYLLEEVLQHQPVEFQRFLLQTSILDRLCAPLCDAVTGRQDSQSILNLLERNNLFIVPLDDQRVWFRYHNLFAGLLRKRLVQLEGDQALYALQQRAIEWYAEQKDWLDAIDHAFACSDYDRAVALIERGNPDLYWSGELNALVRWAEMLPAAYFHGNNRLALSLGWAAHATGRPDICRRMIQVVEENCGLQVADYAGLGEGKSELDDLTRSALVEAAVMGARLDIDRLQVKRVRQLAEMILPDLDASRDDHPYVHNAPYALRGPFWYIMGLANKLRGEVHLAEKDLQSALDEAHLQNNIFIISLAMGQLGEIQALQCRLAEARQTYEQALQIAAQPNMPQSAFFGISRVGLGEIAYEQNRLEEAEADFTAGVAQGLLWNSWECLLPGYTGLARLYQARSESSKAHQSLDRLLEHTRDNLAIVEATAETWRAWLWLRGGDLKRAQAWAENLDLQQPGENLLQWELQLLMVVRLRLALGLPEEALSILKRLQPATETASRWRRMVDIHLLACQAYARLDRMEACLQALQEALALASPGQLVRPFLDEGGEFIELLSRLSTKIQDTRQQRFAMGILQAAKAVSPEVEAAGNVTVEGLVEALSEREIEVLKLMARGLTNPEIARRLYLSPNTLKAHAQNIYQKLDVHSRVQAVNRGRELGLLLD
jgi:LuxR family maltose regulon positive regulatory protein